LKIVTAEANHRLALGDRGLFGPGEQKEFPDAFPVNRNAGDNEHNEE
jgi:hypothetical protein